MTSSAPALRRRRPPRSNSVEQRTGEECQRGQQDEVQEVIQTMHRPLAADDARGGEQEREAGRIPRPQAPSRQRSVWLFASVSSPRGPPRRAARGWRDRRRRAVPEIIGEGQESELIAGEVPGVATHEPACGHDPRERHEPIAIRLPVSPDPPMRRGPRRSCPPGASRFYRGAVHRLVSAAGRSVHRGTACWATSKSSSTSCSSRSSSSSRRRPGNPSASGAAASRHTGSSA